MGISVFRARTLLLVTFVNLSMLGSPGRIAQAIAEDLPEVSGEAWRAQIQASRERADLIRRDRRSFVPPAPTPAEVAAEASRQVLEDDSLLPGDIVSTSRGLFQFRGVVGGERTRDDFVRIR